MVNLKQIPVEVVQEVTSGYKSTLGQSLHPLRTKPHSNFLESGPVIGPGGRNDAVFAHSGRLFTQGVRGGDLKRMLHTFNEAMCIPPLPFDEVEEIALRATRRPELNEQVKNEFAASLEAYRRSWQVQSAPPEPREFLIETGLFPLGVCSVLAGLGGSMKTAFAILLGLHIASGKKWNGYKVAEGQVLIVSGEDDGDEFQRRVGGYAEFEFDETCHSAIAKRVHGLALSGVDTYLTKVISGQQQRTEFVESLLAEADRILKADELPLRLIVLDHARLMIGGDLNASENATVGMTACAHIARVTGSAVLLLAHSPKASAAPKRASDYGMNDVLGSGAFTDTSRFTAVISTLAEDERKRLCLEGEDAKRYLALRVIKSNYSETGRVFFLHKTTVPSWSVAFPKVCSLHAPAKTSKSSAFDHVVVCVSEQPGKYTKTKLRTLSGLKGKLKSSERDVRQAIEQAIDVGVLIERLPTSLEVKEYGVRKTDRVLDVSVI